IKGFESGSKFTERLDMNRRLIRWSNGVTEALNSHITFRCGKPEDYLTMTTKIAFPIEYTNEHPDVRRYLHWEAQTFEDPDLRLYMRRLFASVFIGGNIDKILPIWHGTQGDEGKSTWMSCCKHAL